MNIFLKKLIMFLGITLAISIQLCLLKYEQTIMYNIPLVLYTYSLFSNKNVITLTLFLIILDLTTFIMTGIFGLIIITCTPLTLIIIKIKDNCYSTLILPIIFIISYHLLIKTIFFITLQHKELITDLFLSIIINSLIFILIWFSNKHYFNE